MIEDYAALSFLPSHVVAELQSCWYVPSRWTGCCLANDYIDRLAYEMMKRFARKARESRDNTSLSQIALRFAKVETDVCDANFEFPLLFTNTV